MAPTNRHIWSEKRFLKQFSVSFKDLPCCQRNLDGKLISSNQNLSVCTLKEMRMFNKCTFHSGLFISCTYVCVFVIHLCLSPSSCCWLVLLYLPSPKLQGSLLPSPNAQGSRLPSPKAQGSRLPSPNAQGSLLPSPKAYWRKELILLYDDNYILE